MQPHPENRIWLDLEMTGLNPASDKIIEIATVVTDKELNIIAEGPALAIYQPDEVLAQMDNWNVKQHTRSGLIHRVKASTITEAEAEKRTLEFVMTHVPPGKSPLHGNSICQDRRFLANNMPILERYFNYRNLDVTVLKQLACSWNPGIVNGFKKSAQHLALADVLESIEELRYYQKHFLKVELTDGLL